MRVVLGSAAALAGGSAVVNTIAGMGHTLASNGIHARVLRHMLLPALGWALRHSHTLVQNPDDAALVESLGVQAERIAVVQGAGVDVRRFAQRPEPEGPIRVTRAGRRRVETEFAAARIHEQTLRVYEQALARR